MFFVQKTLIFWSKKLGIWGVPPFTNKIYDEEGVTDFSVVKSS